MTEGELKLKAEQSAPGYMNTVERAIYISAYIDGFNEAEEMLKKYLDCDCCEYQNNKDECHQCNFLEKTRWALKKVLKNENSKRENNN